MLRRSLAGGEDILNPDVRHPLPEQVSHAGDEDPCRRLPLLRIVHGVGVIEMCIRDRYLVSEEHIFFFDDEDVEAVLIEVKGYDEFLSMTDKEGNSSYPRCV